MEAAEQLQEKEGGVESLVEALVENTTVIAVNVADSDGSLLAKPTDASVTRTPSNRSTADAKDVLLKKKLGHRRVKDGEVTYKKFETTQLMGSIQLGIQNSVGNLTAQEDRDLLHADFYTIETVVFSRDGSLQKTPAHNYSQFKFRTYAPLAFRKFRNIFEIERDKFLVSLCAEPMVELSNPGASGSIFYRTQDDEIICKTVSHKESRFLQEILPAYYLNLHQNFRTLLPKFFGFYCHSCNTKNVRIAVMKNLIPSTLTIHHKFDLKGSTYGRQASSKERKKAHPTFKDLDFMEMYPDGIFLQPEIHSSLMDTIERDCRALESLKIMDYSLLLGIHIIDQESKGGGGDELGGGSSGESDEGSDRPVHRRPGMLERVGSVQQRQRLIAHSTALESITAEGDDGVMADLVEEAENDDMSAWGGIPAKNAKGENLLIFIGIIDILQSFGMAKKLEHTWKSLIHDGDTVSVHRPSFYASRFKNFMSERVFRKMAPQLKPNLSFRRSKRISKGAPPPLEDRPLQSARSEVPHRRTQSAGDTPGGGGGGGGGVTVITIGTDTPDAGGILPAVLRDKPRISATPGKAPLTAGRPHSSRPDVADVVAVSCTPPPPDLAGIMNGDERVQIYVPSPQSTPYSTISKQHGLDAHKSITFLNYKESSVSLEGVQREALVSEQNETTSRLLESLSSSNHTDSILSSQLDSVTTSLDGMTVSESTTAKVSVVSSRREFLVSTNLSVAELQENLDQDTAVVETSLPADTQAIQDEPPVSISQVYIELETGQAGNT